MEEDTTAPPLVQLTPDSRQWALFLDFDGTLVELAPTPDAIRVPPALPALLRDLARFFLGAVAIMTGRRLADLDRHLGGTRLPAAGQHGAERRIDPSQPAELPDAAALASARERIEAGARRHEGVLLEDKGASLALHYRAVPEVGDFLRRLAEDLVAESAGALELMPGKAVYEIRPAGSDKGTALHAFMQRPPFAGRRPLVVGDDLTDEYAFAAALAAGGSAVKVGDGATRAPWRIATPKAVREWLAGRLSAGNGP